MSTTTCLPKYPTLPHEHMRALFTVVNRLGVY